MKIQQAEVTNCVQAKTRYGPRLVLNCKLIDTREKVAVWSNDLDNQIFKSKSFGQKIELIEDDKGKFSLLDREESKVEMHRPSSNGSEGSYYSNCSSTLHASSASLRSRSEQKDASPREAIDEIDSLDLPQPMSDQDKVRLSKLIKERAKLLTHTIEVMRDELNDKGLEFHEGSIRSLSVSLFIHIARHLD